MISTNDSNTNCQYVQRGPYILPSKLIRKITLATAQAPQLNDEDDAAAEAAAVALTRVNAMRKAITDVTIRLLYRGDKGPKSVGKSETDTQLSALNSQKQQTMALMCRIYIGSINFSVNEEMIRVAFSPFGPVKHINMSLDLTTNRHKGFAFLEFETPEAAYLSLTQMEGVVLGGRNIKVGRPSNMPLAEPMINQLLQEAKAFPRIYIGSIHPSINKEDVISIFEPFGTIKSTNMPMNPSKPTLHLGYCYIEYTDMKSADDAVSTMNLFELMGYFLRVGKCVTPPLADPLTNSAEVVDEVSKMAQMISKKLNSSKEFSDVRNRQKMNIEVIDSPVAELSNTDQKTESESKLKKRQHRSSDHDQQPGHSSLSPQKSPITSQHSPKRPKSQVDNSSPAVKSKYNENKILQDADPMSRSTLRCHESAKNIEKTVENQLDFISDFDVSSNSTAFPADSKSHVEKLTNGRADSGASNNTPEKKHDPSIKKEEHLKNSTTKDVTAIASSTANLSVEENGNLLRGAEAKELHMHKLMRVKEQRVVVLSNMVGVDDVDEALEEEIKNECSKYASVLRVIIYIQDEYGSDEVKTVHIFIECESEEGAQKLKDIMNGRYFAQRMIAARFYDQELYDESHFQV